MSDKIPFSFLIRPDERATLKQLARMAERSEGATLRWLIREKTRELVAQNHAASNAARDAEKLQEQIAEAKEQPALPPAQQRRIDAIDGDVKEVVEEAKKDKPNPKTISETLKSAAKTMQGVGKAVVAAQGMGKKVNDLAKSIDWGRLALGATALADLAARILSSIPH